MSRDPSPTLSHFYPRQTVDSDELAVILESAGLYFTSSQIQDILTKVDEDDNIALDFPEVLQVSKFTSCMKHYFKHKEIFSCGCIDSRWVQTVHVKCILLSFGYLLCEDQILWHFASICIVSVFHLTII